MARDLKETIKYEILNELGIISEKGKGWNLEFNRISWSGGDPKYDIRQWGPNHEKMGKGITLSENELRELKKLIDSEISFLDE